MNIALIGYGKMGKEIERIALSRGHNILFRIDETNVHELSSPEFSKADIAIEFTNPQSVCENIRKCFKAGVPVVVGTTGWYDNFIDIEHKCEDAHGGLFYATNFSIGVNLFFQINKLMAGLMNNYSQYEVSIDETHHTQKLDAPSGTAITLAEKVMEQLKSKKAWKGLNEGDQAKSMNDELIIKSFRKDNIPGTHTVYYRSEVDTIELSHTAHNRSGFAEGAVTAAEWMAGKKGIFTMKDMLGF